MLAKADAFRIEGAEVVCPGVASNPMSAMTLLKGARDMSEDAPSRVRSAGQSAWTTFGGLI
ncbi:hypothetical protein A9995_12025 [Erythrobacter sp. QSSC1-22B]|nr:hypothetical protein A9995_12025 [Erythrobacter sp. QSSC1-22B]